MKNSNVYDFQGNLEKSIKNGDINQIILFPESSAGFNKLLNSFENKKELEREENSLYSETLIKVRSPFRIGEIRVKVLYCDSIINDSQLDLEKFSIIIKNICKKYKNNINVFPITGQLLEYKNSIINVLEKLAHNTKIAISN